MSNSWGKSWNKSWKKSWGGVVIITYFKEIFTQVSKITLNKIQESKLWKS